MSDAYDLLWEAQQLIARHDDDQARDWLRRFRQLPGVRLTRKAVTVLRHGQQRAHRANAELVQQLLETGYLEKIQNMRRGKSFEQTRLSLQGREALRLRMTTERKIRA